MKNSDSSPRVSSRFPLSDTISLGDAKLYPSDVALLDSSVSWLNDALIHFWFEYLLNKSRSSWSSNKLDQVLFLSPACAFTLSFLSIEDLLADTPENVLKDVSEGKFSLLIIPVVGNADSDAGGGSHWSLLAGTRHLVDDIPFYRWMHYDSCKGMNKNDAIKSAEKIDDLIEWSFGNRGHVLGKSFFEGECIQQDNGFDCGVHLLINAEFLLRSFLSHDDKSEHHIQLPRIHTREDYSCRAMRKRLIKIITELNDKKNERTD